MHSFFASSAILASTLFSAVIALAPGQQTQGSSLAMYWGQGDSQKSLGNFCADSTIDIIPIGFVNVFPDQNGTYGYPGTNFGNACGGFYVDSNNETTSLLGSCPQIGSDIAYCQSQGKKILLSLGGGSTGVFVASNDSATKFADFLYGAFGPASSSWTGPRPFGNVSVDGFDFDIEASASAIPTALGFGYATMVKHLRTLGTMMITASPQCVVPDANMADALANAPFDAIFVQFYNTPQCSARAYFDNTYGAYGGPATDISYDAWISWMQANASNPHALVYLGLPAAPDATFGQMYLNTTEAQEILTHFQGKYPAQFGGAMLWEATFSENNQVNGMSYAANVKCFLTGSCSTNSSTTSSLPSSTPTNSYNGTAFTIPTVSPISTGGYPGSINATGSGSPTVGPVTTTDASGVTHTYTPSQGPTTSSANSPVTTTDRNGNTFTYTPTQGATTSTTISPVTTTDRNGNTLTYTPTQGATTSSANSPVTTTDRNGNTYTYTPTSSLLTRTSTFSSSSTCTPITYTNRNGEVFTYTSTNIQPSGISVSSTTDWSGWDPTSTSSSTSSASTSTTWGEWDPTSTSSSTSSASTSTTWGEWDPTSTSSSTSSASTSTSWGEWDPTSTSTWARTQTWEATITASDASTVTVMPLPATSQAHVTIASWSSYWTERASFSYTESSDGEYHTEWSSSSTADAATVSSSAWVFTGWSEMPSYTTLAPLPPIATVTAGTSVGAAGTSSAANTAPTVGVYVQPNTFLGAGTVAKPVFGLLAALVIGGAAILI